MSKYASRLAQDEKAVRAGQVVLAEANAMAQIEQKISGLKAQKATLAAAYEQALGANPFNVERVFALTTEIEQNKKTLEIAESILSSEFAD